MVSACRTGMGESGLHLESANWTYVVIVALLLLVAQLLPSPLRRHPAFSRIGPDKLLHLLGHALFSAVLVNALNAERVDDRVSAISAVAISTSFGVVTGELQKLVPGRIPERADVIAALVGAVLGAVAWQQLSGEGPG